MSVNCVLVVQELGSHRGHAGHARTGGAAARGPAARPAARAHVRRRSRRRDRGKRLAAAVRDAGWLELRDDGGDGRPLASGVEAAIVADALGGTVADVAFAGPLLAHDLARRAGTVAIDGAVVAFSPALTGPAVVTGATTTEPVYAVDTCGDSINAAHVLVPDGDGYRLARVLVDRAPGGTDLTREIRAGRGRRAGARGGRSASAHHH